MRVCLAVCRAYPTLGVSDRVLADALAARGAEVSVLAWNVAPLADVLANDVVVLRATWDYQDDMAGYDAWTRALEDAGARVWNAPALARWNNDKTTLLTLAEHLAGRVAFPETLRVETLAEAPRALARLGADEAVLKPTWGGSGVGVERVSPHTVAATVERLSTGRGGERPYLVQRFLPEIAEGELSFVFIAGANTHTVLLRPAEGEFRVNSRFAPLPPRLVTAPDAATADARAVLDAIGSPTLYARIDGVLRGDRLVCTEVELTDPWLHLDLAPYAAERMADAILARAVTGR